MDMSNGFALALQKLFAGDTALWQIILFSVRQALIVLAISTVIGVPVGATLALSRLANNPFIKTVLFTAMGLPPVVVGLIVYLLLSRAGPLGSLGWLFTPQAMIVAQVMLATPLIIGLTLSAILSVEPDLASQLRSLGATQTQISRAILREARAGIVVAIATAFGRIASEVGAIMLVGGNVAGETRTLTTAIVLETRQGQFDQAIALGLVLLMIAFTINLILIAAQPKRLWLQT